MKKIYMKVTDDEYELPLAVADSPAELARIVGVTANSVSCQLSLGRGGYRVIEVEEEDDEQT